MTDHHVYSVEGSRKRALVIKIRRAKIMARCPNPDYKIDHADECREASGDHPKYTALEIRVKKDFDKKMKQADARVAKIV